MELAVLVAAAEKAASQMIVKSNRCATIHYEVEATESKRKREKNNV